MNMKVELGIKDQELGIRNQIERNQESGIRNYGLSWLQRYTKLIIHYSLFLILTLAIAPPAQAGVPVFDPATAAIEAQVIKHEIKSTVGARMLGSAVVGLINAITKFAQQFAYDLANGLASGAGGQNPLAFLDNPKEYFKKAGFDAAGEFIGNLSGPWEELGLNLCTPRIPEIGLAIQLGLVTQAGQRPAPKCDFGSILNNWSQISREVQDLNAVLKKVSFAFDPTQTDLGQAFHAQEGLRFQMAERRHALDIAKLEGKGILPKYGLISGKIETPSVVIEENFREVAKAGKDNTLKAGDVIGATLGDADVWVGAAGAVWNTFVNTLISKSLNLALQGLFKPAEEALPDLTKFIGGAPPKAGGATLNPAAVALLTPQIRTSESSLEYLSDLSACPSRELATQFQCTIDQKFAAALQLGRSGSTLTVAEAADPKNGYLDRSKPFGFVNPSTGQEPDYTLGYPYSSLKKLRLLRVLPVGWEFAALKLKQENLPPATLGDVLDGWNNQNSPFYGLVDPNWVLKAPTATCGALTWSASLDGSGTSRQEACADLKHCVAEDVLGTCKAYGYCTRERNSWDFDGDSCEAQFASCDTFKPASGEEISLLENTVEFGSCNAGNAGCMRYFEHQTLNSAGKFDWDQSDQSEKIFFDRDAQTCTQKDQGCTEFIAPTPEVKAILDDGPGEDQSASNTGKLTDQYPTTVSKSYYRAPPDYLNCTGEEGEPAECRDRGYARVCRQDEVGCAEYRPANGDPVLPAVANALDRCPKECADYNTYIKQISAFEPQFTSEGMYMIIPQNSRQCDASAAGCEEFTNLSNEQRQYFTSLRACQKPDPATDKTYFTWEGSDTTGYQLKSWVLKKSNAGAVGGGDVDVITSAPAIPPCTNYSIDPGSTAGETTVNCTDAVVNQAVCDPNVGDPDCRSFYDERGNIFYRKFSRTIISTNECTSYRWTGLPTLPEVADLDRAALEKLACDHGHGFWNDATKQCLYVGAPSQSGSCSATQNGCRGFSGNAGANVQVALSESFEDGLNGWSGGTLSSEALQVQQHSLKVISGNASRTIDNANAQGQTFLVNFLAKGTAGTNLTVKIGQVALGTVALTPTWQTFSLGPATATAANPTLTFVSQGTFFIDEVILKTVVDTVYLVKNSWDIPLSCDSLPAEVGGGISRGAMLGCAEYSTADNKTEYFKSFSNLCRPQSVGCTDLIDTRNSESPFEETFDQGNSEAIDDVKIESDRHRYLVVSPQVACQAAQKGCQGLGKRRSDGGFDSVYLKNDPGRYSTDLCAIEDEGCESWSRKDKSVAYFKAPQGGACEWRTGVKIGAVTYSGWFRKDKQAVVDPSPLASLPTADASPFTSSTNTNKLIDSKQECQGYGKWQGTSCVNAQGNSIEGIAGCAPGLCGQSGQSACSDCANLCTRGVGGTWNDQTGKCETDAPCYGSVHVVGNETLPMLDASVSKNYSIAGNVFGLWRNADPGYAQGRRVGLCPTDQATCTEFRDPTDKQDTDDPGRAYYFKDNERLKDAHAGCPQGASRQAGCVLFNNTAILAKQWNAQATYAASEQKGGAPTSPQSAGTINDVNTLLKVKRDRSCAQWYQCASAQWVWDEQTSQFRSVCHQQALCNELAPTPVATGLAGDCVGWVNLARKNTPFDIAEYFARDRTFAGQEYVGYSIPNLYPLGQLEEKKEEEKGKFKLGFKISTATSETFKAPDGTSTFSATPGLPGYWNTSCRGYPEPNSPFPSTAEVNNNFKNAPKCSMVNGEYQCECSYKAIDYGGTFRYFEPDFDKAPIGICLGATATTKADCEKAGGTWQPQTGENNAVGWLGYCLERDESRAINASKDSRACLTWWPIDRIKAAPDVYNQFAEAGYTFPQGYGRYFCLLGSKEGQIDKEDSAKLNLTSVAKAAPGFLTVKDIPVDELNLYQGDIKEWKVTVNYDPQHGGAAPATYTLPADTATNPNDDLPAIPTVENTGGQCDPGDKDEGNLSTYGCYGYSTKTQSSLTDQFQGWWWWVGDDNSWTGQWDKDGDDEGRGAQNGSPLAYQLAAQVMAADPSRPEKACTQYDDSYDGVAVLLHFTDETSPAPGKLDKIRIGVCAGTASPIGRVCSNFPSSNCPENTTCFNSKCASNNPALPLGEYMPAVELQFRLHPYCEYLYKVDPQPGSARSAPNTQALFEGSNTQVSFLSETNTYSSGTVSALPIPNTVYERSTVPTPFGSSSQNINVNPADFTHPWFLNFNRTEDPSGKGIQTVPFAGWPYGCPVVGDYCTVNSRLSINDKMITPGVETPFQYEITPEIWAAAGKPPEYLPSPYPTIKILAPTDISQSESAGYFGQLFAKGAKDSVFAWFQGKYINPLLLGGDLIWNNTTAIDKTPIIAAPTSTPPCEAGICQDPAPQDVIPDDWPPFAINGVSGHNQYVTGYNGYLLATAQFHAWANSAQMPLRKIVVDWGDGFVESGEGLYRNHRGLQAANTPLSVCDGSDAGRLPEKSCKTAFYAYDHRYSCRRPGSGETAEDVPGWTNSAPVCTSYGFASGCCIFRPKIQVQDNWGLCNSANGSCAQEGQDGFGQAFWGAVVVGPRP